MPLGMDVGLSPGGFVLDGDRGAGTVSGQGGQTFLEKNSAQSAEKNFQFAHSGFQFAHPGFNNMGGQRPSCDYGNKS